MTFDPNTMQCLRVEAGPFLKQGGTTFFPPPIINNTAGWVRAGCAILVGSGVTGSGTLANVTFHCKGEGESLLGFSYTRLVDSTGSEILHGVGLGSVTQQQRKNITFRLLAVEGFLRR